MDYEISYSIDTTRLEEKASVCSVMHFAEGSVLLYYEGTSLLS